MRELQDNFYNKVGIKTGLTRLGPGGRRRLTRAEWQAEKQKSRALANAKAVASSGYRAGLKKAKAEATEIVAQAQEKAKGLGVKMSGWFAGLAGGWHEPSAKPLPRLPRSRQRLKGSGRGQESPRRGRKGQDQGEEGSRREGRQCCQPTDRRANQE